MELSEELFAEIVGVSEQPPIYDGAHERRRHPRVAFGCRARIFPLIESAGGNGCPVLIRDISRSGIGFLFSHPLEVGDEFVIHLPKQSGQVVQIMCMAQRCHSGGTCGKHYVIGATLELVLESNAAPAPRTASTDAADPFAREAVDWPAPPRKFEGLRTFAAACWNRLVRIATLDRSSSRLRKRLNTGGEKSRNATPAAAAVSLPTPDATPAIPPPSEATAAADPSPDLAPLPGDHPRVSLFKKKEPAPPAPVEPMPAETPNPPAVAEPAPEQAAPAVTEQPAALETPAVAPALIEPEPVKNNVDVVASEPAPAEAPAVKSDLQLKLSGELVATQPRRPIPFHVIRATSRRRR